MNRSHRSLFNKSPCFREVRIKPPVETNLQANTGCCDRTKRSVNGRQVERDGLFAEDVFAGSCRFLDERCMGIRA